MSMPPLPIPVLKASKIIESASGVLAALYTADQMKGYGQQCREAALLEAAMQFEGVRGMWSSFEAQAEIRSIK